MMRNDNLNYFAVLGILQPTMDKKIIREAYKALLLQIHPDKNPDSDPDRCKQVIAAYEYLEDENNRRKHFDLFNGTSHASTSSTADARFASSPPENIFVPEKQDALVVPGVKATVYIPVTIFTKSVDPSTNNGLFGDENNNFFDASSYRFVDPDHFDVQWLTEMINRSFKVGLTQVGVDCEEVFDIVMQHSFYKLYRGAYGVAVEIDLKDLILERASESDLNGPGLINAGKGKYFWAKQNTIITAADIKKIQLAFDDIANPGTFLLKEIKRETTIPLQSAVHSESSGGTSGFRLFDTLIDLADKTISDLYKAIMP